MLDLQACALQPAPALDTTEEEGVDEASNARSQHQPVAAKPDICGQVADICGIERFGAVDGDVKADRRGCRASAFCVRPGKIVGNQAYDDDGEDACENIGRDKKWLGFEHFANGHAIRAVVAVRRGSHQFAVLKRCESTEMKGESGEISNNGKELSRKTERRRCNDGERAEHASLLGTRQVCRDPKDGPKRYFARFQGRNGMAIG